MYAVTEDWREGKDKDGKEDQGADMERGWQTRGQQHRCKYGRIERDWRVELARSDRHQRALAGVKKKKANVGKRVNPTTAIPYLPSVQWRRIRVVVQNHIGKKKEG